MEAGNLKAGPSSRWRRRAPRDEALNVENVKCRLHVHFGAGDLTVEWLGFDRLRSVAARERVEDGGENRPTGGDADANCGDHGENEGCA